MLSIRSTLTVGVAASLVAAGVGTAAVTTVASAPLPTLVSPALELSAVVSALPAAAAFPTPPGPIVLPTGDSAGDWIINTYNAVEPWVDYGVELVSWAFSWLPWPIGLIGPQADILYSGWQPIGQSLAYSAAYLLDRQFELIVPTLVNGVKTGISNLVQNEIQWVLSFFPPLPPINFPVLPGATTLARSAAALPRSAATARTSAAQTAVATPVVAATPSAGTPVLESPAMETPAAEAADDGTTTVYFGPEQPEGVARGNWIQTDPNKGWFNILRLYSPLPSYFDKTWRPSEIELVE